MALLLLPSLAAAAGLGKLTVFSALGQPLKAEIELLAVQKGEADNLSVRLPPADVFRKANIEYSGALLSVKFSIAQRGEDRYVIVLSSGQPINEPFLDLMVELDWTTGRLVREYTFLLDPPEYKAPQAAPAMAAPVTGAPVIKSVEMPKQALPDGRAPGVEQGLTAPVREAVAPKAAAPRATAPKATAPKAAAPKAAAPKAAAPKAVKSYQVKHGDTLTKIANANRSDRVSLQQMLIALYRSNMDEFEDNNINRLRAGKILNIPDMDAAAAVDQDEATRTVLAHAADFNEYRRQLAAAVAAAPERADKRLQSASGKITARVEDKPAAAKDARDQLKLSQAEEAGKPGAKRSAQGLQEDLFAKEKEIKDANERIAMLEKNVRDMQKLLELKSQPGALLQQQAAKAGATKAVEPVKAPVPAKTAEPAKTLEPVKAPEPAQAADAMKAPEPAKAAPKAAAPKTPAKPVAPAPPAPEPSFVDEILANELALYGGGAFLLLLFAAYAYYAWRRKKTLQQMESSAMAAPDLASDSVFGALGDTKFDTGPSEFQGDFSQGGTAAAIGTEEVDPIAEADVYMAYGRDAQAEEILKEALAKEPSRQPIRAKLLEIYANRKDAKAFEAVAAEIHAATNGAGAEWEKAVALGAQLDPGNPLYGGMQAEGETHAVTDTQVVSGAERTSDIVLDMGGEPEATPGLDFDLGLSEPARGSAPQPELAPAGGAVAETSPGLDFDLGLGEPAQAEASRPELAMEGGTGPEVSPALDFDLGLSEPAQGGVPQPELAPEEGIAPATDVVADLGFDLDLGGGAEIKTEPAQAEQQSEAAAGSAPSLEGSATGTPADAVASIDFDFELPGAAAESAPLQALAEPEVAAPEVPVPSPLEVPAPEVPKAPAPEFPEIPVPEALGVPAPEVPVAAAEGGIDFDFNLNLPEQKDEMPSVPLDLSSISLDLGAPGEATLSSDAHWQEVATKLDLAKAYQEMGDLEGARELLNEVLKEGDAAQQQQAQTLLAALG
ncbi:MAG: FimV/HubP family polar landmark protein [Burkholderiales bacterium]